jgi:hypothetical protein
MVFTSGLPRIPSLLGGLLPTKTYCCWYAELRPPNDVVLGRTGRAAQQRRNRSSCCPTTTATTTTTTTRISDRVFLLDGNPIALRLPLSHLPARPIPQPMARAWLSTTSLSTLPPFAKTPYWSVNSKRHCDDNSLHLSDGGPHQQGPDSSNPTNETRPSEAGNDDEDDGMFWATFVMVVLIGSNLVALWCEHSMTPNQSLLRGLATLRSESTSDESVAGDDDHEGHRNEEPPRIGSENAKISRRRTTRIVYLRW